MSLNFYIGSYAGKQISVLAIVRRLYLTFLFKYCLVGKQVDPSAIDWQSIKDIFEMTAPLKQFQED